MAVQQSTSTKRLNKLEENSIALNGALKSVKEDPSSENIKVLIGLFAPLRDQLMSSARFMAGYTRRHPVRMGLSALALGFLASRFWKTSARHITE